MSFIDHIAVYCIDLEGMKIFFEKYFWCTSGKLYENQRTGFKSYFLSFAPNGTRLEIMSRPEVDSANNDLYRHGYAHIAISLDSKECVDKKTAELIDAGYECMGGPRTTGDGYYESQIIGPEGIIIEITQNSKP